MSLTLRGLVDAAVRELGLPASEVQRALAKELPGPWLHRNCDRELDRRARERRERGEMPAWMPKEGAP